MNNIVLSLFPGIDLLGRGFEEEGWFVVRGPDLLWGGDIRNCHPPRDVFSGIIAGPPCQDFSCARRSEPTGQGLELLGQLARCLQEAQPEWWLVENVPACPDLALDGYQTQRLDIYSNDFGGSQRRLRHFQFGNRLGRTLVIPRERSRGVTTPAALASEGERGRKRRGWSEFCALQGSPPLVLPGLTIAAKYRAVGNGVPLPVSRAFARAIQAMLQSPRGDRACTCGCGRPVTGRRTLARGACRQRELRRRRGRYSSIVRGPGTVTPGR